MPLRQGSAQPCRRKMRMSGLCKVEMSAFMGGRGAHGDGANGLESTRTGSHRSVARSTARTCNPGGRARRLHLSDRQVRRLLLGIAKQGDRAVVHGLWGRPSNRRLARSFEQKVLARVRQRYADFGPTLAAEHLAEEGLA